MGVWRERAQPHGWYPAQRRDFSRLETLMLKLYYAAGTCALASHIALEETGVPFETVRVNLRSNAQRSPQYLAINPKGRVPALVTQYGVLTETPALLAYIAQTFTRAGLAPLADPFEFARVQAFNSYLCATAHVAHSHRMRGYRWADDAQAIAAMQRHVPDSVGECFDLIEREMFAGPWVMGETNTICDPYLFTLAQFLEDDGVDPARFPKVLDFRNRMSARPAVMRALADELRED
jgi:glutathione S-transferase